MTLSQPGLGGLRQFRQPTRRHQRRNWRRPTHLPPHTNTLVSLLLKVEAQVHSRDPATVRVTETKAATKAEELTRALNSHSGKHLHRPSTPPRRSPLRPRGAAVPSAWSSLGHRPPFQQKLLRAESRAVGGKSSCAPGREASPPDRTCSGGGWAGLPSGARPVGHSTPELQRSASLWSLESVSPPAPSTPTGKAPLPKPGERAPWKAPSPTPYLEWTQQRHMSAENLA